MRKNSWTSKGVFESTRFLNIHKYDLIYSNEQSFSPSRIDHQHVRAREREMERKRYCYLLFSLSRIDPTVCSSRPIHVFHLRLLTGARAHSLARPHFLLLTMINEHIIIHPIPPLSHRANRIQNIESCHCALSLFL